MFTDILYLLGGIALLIAGGNYLTDGAVAVAKKFKVSSLMIGLTVVAMGSAMPDIAVCVESALENKTSIAVGNIVGANIFDLFLVVGFMGIFRPWRIGNFMLKRDLPILGVAMISLWIVADSVIFDGATENIIDRSSGLMLIVVFSFYMWLTVQGVKSEETVPTSGVSASHVNKAEKQTDTVSETKPWLSWTMIVCGLGALVLGGSWVVDGASGIALKAGMSEGLVALTVVAIGNSLPDLVTSLTAAIKGQSSLAFGNIVGACIIDALLAIGLSSTITPLNAGTVGFFDFLTLVGASLLVLVLPYLSRKRSIGRIGGAILVSLYVAYMVVIIIRG